MSHYQSRNIAKADECSQYNFSTYTVFWDNLLGTTWADKAGAEERYKRVHALAAERSQGSTQTVVVTDREMEKVVVADVQS